MSDDLDGATVMPLENETIPNAGAFAAYWNSLDEWARDRLFDGIRRANDEWFRQQLRLPELEQLREMRAALIAPWDLYAAVSATWATVSEDVPGGTLIIDEQDEVVLAHLRALSPDDLRRAGFVLAIVRSLAMATRAEL